MSLWALVLLVVFGGASSSQQVYTSRLAIDRLFHIEGRMLASISRALDGAQREYRQLTTILRQHEHVHVQANGSHADAYLDNPVNAYTLIRRMSIDWQDIRRTVLEASHSDQLQHAARLIGDSAVGDEDLDGAVQALLRLQRMYSIDVEDMVAGRLAGSLATHTLTTQDCLRLVWLCVAHEDATLVADWMLFVGREWLNRPHDEVSLNDLIVYTELSAQIVRNVVRHINGFDGMRPAQGRAADLLKKHVKKLNNLLTMDTELKKLESVNTKSIDSRNKRKQEIERSISRYEMDGDRIFFYRGEYTKMCRGTPTPTTTSTTPLYCYYEHSAPFLTLQPLKTEILHINPRLYLFHEIISPFEVDTLRQLARSRMEDAESTGEQRGAVYSAAERLAQVAWLDLQPSHPVLDRVNRRVAAISALSAADPQPLQASNYGIGGHFSPHLEHSPEQTGRHRLGTFLLYGSDVVAGGDTVFLRLGLKVPAVAGSALFWYNYRRSGALDERLVHAGCPVLVGNKWEFNKWILSDGQMIHTQCGLAEETEQTYNNDVQFNHS